jgi:NDP-sugar pyrophosphorylase family protein
MKAMILAAGLGTRLKPLTDTIPKPLIEINGHTLLEHTIEYLKKYGIHDILINVHHHAEQIMDYIEDKKGFGVSISFSHEMEKPLDTGGGLKKAKWYFDQKAPFLLMASDVLTDLDLNKLICSHKADSDALVTLAVKNRQTSRHLLFDEKMRLSGWKNNQTNEKIFVKGEEPGLIARAFSVIHIIEPEIFDCMPDEEVFSLTPFYLNLARSHIIRGYDHSDGQWLEFGRLNNLQDDDMLIRAKQIAVF